jgi:hypothetical protein
MKIGVVKTDSKRGKDHDVGCLVAVGFVKDFDGIILT